MSRKIQYELHAVRFGTHESSDVDRMPWHDEAAPKADPPFPIFEKDGTVWARLNGESGLLERSIGSQGAEFALRVVKRRFSADLALLTRRSDVLVNGLPALKMTLLGTKDSVRLAPGCMFYVTERVTPYVGPATAEMVGKKCPFCRVPIAAKAHVVTCRCGAVYHNETAESHPDLSEEDRLNCIDKLQTCLACGHQLTLDEYLVWDPETL